MQRLSQLWCLSWLRQYYHGCLGYDVKRTKTNTEMVEIVTLRRENKNLTDRNAELTKMLSRAAREIETLQAQLGDNGSRYLLDKIKHVIGE